MKRNTVIKLAVSTALISIPTTGCASFSSKQAGISKTAEASEKKAAKWAVKAEKYLSTGDVDKSVAFAEKAVEADFRNSSYRSILARGYIAQGRYVSAERTLQDVLDLGQSDPRTVISMALLRTSQGKTDSAISLLNSYRDILPAGDYGLALAVSGDTQKAVASLVESVKNSNTSRVRQNLAMAYALNGQWREARIMASQDLTGTQVNENITKWAQLARPDAYQERVATLLGTKPIQDAGQPVRLALNSRGNPDVNLASLAGNDQELASEDQELAAIGPAPVSLTDKIFGAKEDDVKVAVPAVQSTNIPASSADVSTPSADRFIVDKPSNVIKAPVQPVKVAVKKPAQVAKPAKLALAPQKTAARNISKNSYMVQLGAFSSVKNANAAWGRLTEEFNVLEPFRSTNTAVNSKGRTLYRLSAMGFANKEAAVSICDRIKSKGGNCIVRVNSVGSPTRLASSQQAKIASRK